MSDPAEHCLTYDVDGEPVTVRGPRPLDDAGQAALAELVRAVRDKVDRESPNLGVVQDLLRAVRIAVACIPDGPNHTPLFGERDGATVRSELKVAAATAHAALSPRYAARLRAQAEEVTRG